MTIIFKNKVSSDLFITFFSWCLILTFISFVTACSTTPEPVKYDLTTNSAAELDVLRTELSKLDLEHQASVFAPVEYKESLKYLNKASEGIKDNDDHESVLKDLGIARAYMDKIAPTSNTISSALLEVRDARKLAIEAGAMKLYRNELAKIDSDLRDETEEGVSNTKSLALKDKVSFQRRYLDLELMSMKADKLGYAKSYIEAAKKFGAQRITPKTLKEAQEKYQEAELAIETNRHDRQMVDRVSSEATQEAQRLVEVTKGALVAKNQSPEQLALEIQNAEDLQKEKSQEAEELTGQLGKSQAMESAMAKAQSAFKPNEAEVYRQGDKLLIRVKALHFNSGSASIPNNSVNLLGKVRDVVTTFNPSKMIVEGHTDIVGSKKLNMRLSQRRADAVAKYFVSTNAIDEDEVSVRGVGPEKPIKTNNTPEGRATNRRVDLILEPSTM